MSRERVLAARRVVVKVGSSSLTLPSGELAQERIDSLTSALSQVRERGAEVILVSSGAIAAGLGPLGLKKRPRDLATQQAAASVGQGLLMHRYTEAFAARGVRVGQVLLTVDDVIRRSQHLNASRTFTRLLELGVLPVVNENDTVATSEIRFGDNDRLAALVAHLVHADLLVLLSDVDGLYDGDPRRRGARLIEEVASERDLDGVRLGSTGASGVGTGGMVTKVEAARIATGAGITALLGSADCVAELLVGEGTGTIFHPTGKRRSTRLLWLRHAADPKGRLILDSGAVKAIRERKTSLLPAGVVSAEGAFQAGDPVDLIGPDGQVVGRGLVNFDISELPDMIGRSTKELGVELGPAYERELVHRDVLVVL